MDQRAAFDATIELARERGMGRVTPRLDPDLTFAHLLDMQSRITPDMSEAKLGRWLGWAQAAVVAANVGVTLDDMKAINKRFADDAPTPRTVTTVEELEALAESAVVLGADGEPYRRSPVWERHSKPVWETFGMTGSDSMLNADQVPLPATVLYPAPSASHVTDEQVEAMKALAEAGPFINDETGDCLTCYVADYDLPRGVWLSGAGPEVHDEDCTWALAFRAAGLSVEGGEG